ncbi:hypothetical protein BT69DRAFT_510497 [Atractiella rhizophila]|nr:hypothetical protein BT69DRAFT_510497 [Atractiella rhizophila]
MEEKLDVEHIFAQLSAELFPDPGNQDSLSNIATGNNIALPSLPQNFGDDFLSNLDNLGTDNAGNFNLFDLDLSNFGASTSTTSDPVPALSSSPAVAGPGSMSNEDFLALFSSIQSSGTTNEKSAEDENLFNFKPPTPKTAVGQGQQPVQPTSTSTVSAKASGFMGLVPIQSTKDTSGSSPFHSLFKR